jgi:hypothetical protein
MNTMKNHPILLILFTLLTGVFISSCDSSGDPDPLEAVTISNLPADPPTGFDPNTGAPIGTTGKHTLFNFSTGEPVSEADLLTDKWDIGFRATEIIINGGKDRAGSGGAIILTGTSFDQVKEAPESGYLTDNGSVLAITPTWYNYNPSSKIITPLAGNVFVIRTATGKYAKMEILSYYQDAPPQPSSTTPARYYTFRYVYQPAATRKLQ